MRGTPPQVISPNKNESDGKVMERYSTDLKNANEINSLLIYYYDQGNKQQLIQSYIEKQKIIIHVNRLIQMNPLFCCYI